ncbi:hypothetical protein [Kitasatospora sp. MMS16-BH015]|uniref:hypothetical protein n=1 Tax=Kitasatospora sp. MMS16-BH015 TaxID=2018025 RepID=UPI000CF2C727|nr:hypothetical protein [Kitasatospora sp. MMS16-BH015]
MQRTVRAAVAALAVSAGALAAAGPAWAATVIGIGTATLDPKIPSKVKVTVTYACDAPAGEKSLNVSVEQTDPQDASAVAFGSTRVSPVLVLCDGAPHTQEVTVQSKTTAWVPEADAVVVTTVSDLGSAPPAFADAQKIPLHSPAP